VCSLIEDSPLATNKTTISDLPSGLQGADRLTLTLEEENSKLKKLVADLSLDKEMLQDVIRRKI
jgi:hypothetical protein